jgi:hypothetical protein
MEQKKLTKEMLSWQVVKAKLQPLQADIKWPVLTLSNFFSISNYSSVFNIK